MIVKRRTVTIQIVDNTIEITDLNHNQISSHSLFEKKNLYGQIGFDILNYLLTSEDGKRRIK